MLQGDSYSIKNQKQILFEYAEKNGYTNCQYYVDDGISGTTFDREGFQNMISDVEAGKVGTVIVKDMSRSAFNIRQHLPKAGTLEIRAGVTVVNIKLTVAKTFFIGVFLQLRLLGCSHLAKFRCMWQKYRNIREEGWHIYYIAL